MMLYVASTSWAFTWLAISFIGHSRRADLLRGPLEQGRLRPLHAPTPSPVPRARYGRCGHMRAMIRSLTTY